MKRAALIIAKEGFQDIELNGTRQALVNAGYEITLISTETGRCIGKFEGEEEATLALADLAVDTYDCIAFIGGPGAAALAENEEAKRIARDAVQAHIPLGAICVAPTILARAGVLKKKKATVCPGNEQILAEEGAQNTGKAVTVDGLIVTGNGPDAAAEFGQQFVNISLGNA